MQDGYPHDYRGNGGQGVPWGDDDIWPQYLLGVDEGALKHMGQQEDMLATMTADVDHTHCHQPPLPRSTLHPEKPFDDYVGPDHMSLGPDFNVFDWVGPSRLENQDFNTFEVEPGANRPFETSYSYENTPSLMTSPHTSMVSDFELYRLEADDPPSRTTTADKEQYQAPEPKPGTKRKGSITLSPNNMRRVKTSDQDQPAENLPFECRHCDMHFDQEGKRTKHEKNKHTPKDGRPYPCDDCESTFHWPKDLRRHMERKHKDVVNVNKHTSTQPSPQLSNDAPITKGSQKSLDHEPPLEGITQSEMPDISALTSFESLINGYSFPGRPWNPDHTPQQDWLCETNNPDHHHTFPRAHFSVPGDGSAPHRGARV